MNHKPIEALPLEECLNRIGDEVLGPLDRVSLLTVRLPFRSPFGTSVHVWAHRESLLLRIDHEGITAWSECVADPDPYYSPETVNTARHIIKDFLVPLLAPEKTLRDIFNEFRKVRGNSMAKAAVENVLLDLTAKRRGIPLHALFGCVRKPIMSGISIGLKESVSQLLAAVEQAIRENYHRIKIKIARGKDVEWVEAVRARFPDIPLMADANGDYSLRDRELLKKLDRFNLTMIEQPLSYSDIYEHSLLQRELSTPLCLDESIHDLKDAQAAVALGSCRIINIKQGRVGGLIESFRLADFACRHGIPVWSGGMDETGIGRAVNIHLQTMEGFTLPGDTSATSRYFEEDIVEPPVVLEKDGSITIPGGPGIGVKVLENRLFTYLLDSERLL